MTQHAPPQGTRRREGAPALSPPLARVLALLMILLLALVVATCGPAAAANPSPGPTATAGAGDCLKHAPKPPADARSITVRRVVDGDTIELADADKTHVRLLGINTPESVDPRRPVQAFGKEASAFTRRLLEGKSVLLARGRQPYDKYHRLLAWLWLPDGRFVNAYLVQQGYAQVYTFSDNPDYADLLVACQREARAANRGLWALPVYANGGEAAKMDR